MVTAKLLLQYDAEVVASDKPCSSALKLAGRQNYASLVGMLVKSGADIDAHDGEGRTPPYAAATHGHRQIATFLLNGGRKCLCRREV